MPQKAEHTVYILEGKAILYKRAGTPHWQVRYKAGGKWLRSTTKQADLDEAKSVATDLIMNAWFRAKNDMPVVNKRFKAVANIAIKRMEDALKAEQGKVTFTSYIRALKNYHIPLLGKHNIDKITYSVLQEFDRKRIELMGKPPTASTLNTHNSALNRVFDVALQLGFMTKSQVPELQNTGGQSNRRPDIRIEEYEKLLRGMRAYIQAAREGYERDIRLLLRDYVLILANTGIRPGTEAMNLKWQHISITTKNEKQYLTLSIKGKTKKWRTIQVRHRVARYLQRIQERDAELNKMTFAELIAAGVNKPVFKCGNTKDLNTALGRVFTRMMESCGLLFDKRTEQHRTLYSLRHFYATHELTKGNVTAYQLAEHMGTSIGMIQQHYGHLDLAKLADKFAGAGSIEAALRKIKQTDVAQTDEQ
jgi:integrase